MTEATTPCFSSRDGSFIASTASYDSFLRPHRCPPTTWPCWPEGRGLVPHGTCGVILTLSVWRSPPSLFPNITAPVKFAAVLNWKNKDIITSRIFSCNIQYIVLWKYCGTDQLPCSSLYKMNFKNWSLTSAFNHSLLSLIFPLFCITLTTIKVAQLPKLSYSTWNEACTHSLSYTPSLSHIQKKYMQYILILLHIQYPSFFQYFSIDAHNLSWMWVFFWGGGCILYPITTITHFWAQR